MKPAKSWLQTLFFRDRRKSTRQDSPRLVAYYWNGAAPVAHTILNASSTGFYVLTGERWYPNTMITMTLQRTDSPCDSADQSISIQTKVVRAGTDGVGFTFVLPGRQRSRQAQSQTRQTSDRKSLDKFLRQLESAKGQALIEYILLLPLIFLLIVNVVNFGGFFYAWITVANAARAGADYAILGAPSVGSLQAATAGQITSLITQDMSSLPNASSQTVNICQNFNGTVTTLAGTCSSIPTDPEPTSYVLTSVDVTYTYVPFIPAGFQFPNLNIYATIPPTTIHRRSVMRSFQ